MVDYKLLSCWCYRQEANIPQGQDILEAIDTSPPGVARRIKAVVYQVECEVIGQKFTRILYAELIAPPCIGCWDFKVQLLWNAYFVLHHSRH